MPSIQKVLNIKIVDEAVEDFMISMVKQSLEHREKNNVTRKDLFQLLIQLRNTGSVQDDGDWETQIQNNGNRSDPYNFIYFAYIYYASFSFGRIWETINSD